VLEALQPQNPIMWVDPEAGLAKAVQARSSEPEVGLDVETTLKDQALCLVQLASRERTFVVGALEVTDLAPRGELMASPAVAKVTHNAAFERAILGRYGIESVPRGGGC
jgi:ribonuclease D